MLVTSLEMCRAMQGRRRVDELEVEEELDVEVDVDVEDWESSHNSSPVDRYSSHYHCPSTNPLSYF